MCSCLLLAPLVEWSWSAPIGEQPVEDQPAGVQVSNRMWQLSPSPSLQYVREQLSNGSKWVSVAQVGALREGLRRPEWCLRAVRGWRGWARRRCTSWTSTSTNFRSSGILKRDCKVILSPSFKRQYKIIKYLILSGKANYWVSMIVWNKSYWGCETKDKTQFISSTTSPL